MMKPQPKIHTGKAWKHGHSLVLTIPSREVIKKDIEPGHKIDFQILNITIPKKKGGGK